MKDHREKNINLQLVLLSHIHFVDAPTNLVTARIVVIIQCRIPGIQRTGTVPSTGSTCRKHTHTD